MGDTVSTDKNAVTKFALDIANATNDINFKPTYKINDSTSPATDELNQLMSSFQTTIATYKTCLTTESKNVSAVHKAIETTDLDIAAGIKV